MLGLIGFVFSVVFGILFGTTKFALRNAIRAAAFGLVGYFVYELVTGYSHGKAGLPAPAPAAPPAPSPEASDEDVDAARRIGPATGSMPAIPASAATAGGGQSTTGRSPLVGAGDHRGRPVQVADAGGVAHNTRVGRGVIRR